MLELAASLVVMFAVAVAVAVVATIPHIHHNCEQVVV